VFGSLANLFSRRYRTIQALDGVSFEIAAGEIVGLIGPNGAGKSTTIKILTGILTPTRGTVRMMGVVPHQNRPWVGQRLGAVFGQRTQLWWDLTPLDGFQMLKHIYDIPEADYQRNLTQFTAILDLEPFLTQPVRKLSLGQRVRADLAAALLHNPQVLCLDEPMLGLDVVVKDRVHSLIRHLASEKGTTILLTTHDLGDIEATCPRALILNHGRLLYDGSLNHLKTTLGSTHLLRCVLLPGQPDPSARLAGLDWLGASPSYSPETRQLSVSFDARATSSVAIIRLIMENFSVETLALVEPPIEDLIKPFYLSSPALDA
jgi:ABC-2 type transport system ATP-binding protein